MNRSQNEGYIMTLNKIRTQNMKQFQLHKKTLNRKEEELLDEMARIQMQMKDADLDTSVSHDQIS